MQLVDLKLIQSLWTSWHFVSGLTNCVLQASKATARECFYTFGSHKRNTFALLLQLDFPFIETHRCKEIHFHIRLKETWKHKDHDYNDIDYEVTRRMRSAESRQRKSIEVIDDMVSDEVGT